MDAKENSTVPPEQKPAEGEGDKKEEPPAEGDQAPATEATAEPEKPAEPEKEMEKPAEPEQEAEKPAEPEQEAEKPAVPEQEAEKPAEAEKEAEKPAEPEQEAEKPAEAEKEAEKPAEAEKEAEKPAVPEKEAEKPAEAEKEAEKPAEPEQEAEKPAVPEKEAEKPAEPVKEVEKPAEPATATEPAEHAASEPTADAAKPDAEQTAGATEDAGAKGEAPPGGETEAKEGVATDAGPVLTESKTEGEEAKPEGEAAAEQPAAFQEVGKKEEGEKKPAEDAEKKAEDGEEKKDDEKENLDKNKEEDKDGDKKEGGEEGKEKVEGEGEGGEEKEGEEIEEEKKRKEEEEAVKIPVDFFYNYDEMKSSARVTEGSGLPNDLLSLQHSFGYDCQRRNNLYILDEKHLMFMAGNILQLLNIDTKKHTYIRSTSGGSIGALAVHPNRKHFAVGEKGSAPNINVFEYPSLKLYRILRGGTESSYSSLNFSPDGELLASQGGDPDFMLTVWNWRQEQIMLRTKAFSQDVFRVTFAAELEGQLTTAGTSHIRFWKMADTFTGLKLQGELGRFGRTEISDIEGYVELPDGKVLSGSEWGNLMLWDGGLIKVEIARKGRKPCHHGPIMQILLDEGELMTVGVDGYIRVWDFETIDTADSTDDTGMFEMEPMNELRVSHDVQLYTIVKSVDDENEPTIWYAQDAKGGIWKLDLSFSHTSMAPEKLMSYHAGPIMGCVTSPVTHLAASIGVDHSVRVFDYGQQKQLHETHFNVGGCSICWAPQIVDSKGSSVVAGFQDGVVRVLCVTKTPESSRKRNKNECEVLLKQAFKPHSQAVTAMAYDGKGQILATGSKDGTVFFMNVGDPYEPIGFTPVPAPVLHLVWTPEKYNKQALMVVCEGGLVVEMGVPDVDKTDTAHTYQIPQLPMRSYQFRSVKSKLRHEEELERKRIEEAERKKREEEERRKRIERGLETESEQGDEEEHPRTGKEEEWHPFIPSDPSPILHAVYDLNEEGSFWLSMGEFDAGYLYKCKFTEEDTKAKTHADMVDEPVLSVAVADSKDVPISTLKFSVSGGQVLFGMEDGSVRVQTLLTPHSLANMGAFWCLPMHDAQTGRVRALALTYEQTQLMSVGDDGNFFLYNYMADEELQKRIAENKARLPSARKEDLDKIVDDIDDPSAYSIEDAKQKAEHDKLMKEAEEKKRDIRRQIAKLRRQFKSILEQNETLPLQQQLDRLEFEMDREIKLELEKQTHDRVLLVRKELAWESEKQRLALEKLRKRFKDVVECERIVLKAFMTPHEVTSFRANKLSEDFYQLKAEYERKKTMGQTKDDFTRDPTRDLLAGQQRMAEGAGQGSDAVDADVQSKVITSLKGSMGERISKALSKVEEKKKKRAIRRAMWEDLYASKPDDNYEDPSDVEAIHEAEENMGDYKLKTAKDYVVPDHLRMNVEKARGRLLILKDQIHEYKYEFNVRLLALRDKKIRIIEEIRQLVGKLNDVQADLKPSKHRPAPEIPEMHSEEMPEKRLEYTRDTLITFKKEMMEQEATSKQQGGDFGGSGFGGGAAPQPTVAAYKQMSFISNAARSQEEEEEELELEEEEETLSPLEKEIQQTEQIRLEYKQSRLLGQMEKLVTTFDAELRLVRDEKFKLDTVMKNADLRQVTLFEELVLLKEYEKSEDVLAEKVTSKQQEKLDMQNKIVEVQARLETKRKDIEKMQEKERTVHQTFLTTVGDNKFQDYLTKVFKKKIKRNKKKTTEGEGSDDESEDESDDDSDWEESDEESESEMGGYDLDICPPGCDQTLYDAATTMRERRLDCEEALAEEKKNSETLKKELEGLQKKARIIDSSLKTAQNDLEAFQLEKQQKLNELKIVTTLHLHQIQYIINSTLPSDLSNTLVFESPGVVRLQHRIKELEHEKTLQKKHMKESRRKHVQLIKDRRHFDAKIAEMEGKCDAMMVAKFGCTVDMEKLETVTVNRTIEELKEKLRQIEMLCADELVKWDKDIDGCRTEITERVRDNTRRLDQLGMLLEENKSYQRSLDKRQKNLGDEYVAVRRADVRERQRLVQLVQLQAQEIDALKDEILLLSRKGGHILPPAQPPMTHSP
ncbi:cilia- and flagella-associated protein 44-like [Littorina saxatilis]|uniref:Cilia- and flagella-associated protein 44 n=1 Tax=Littorina saxatilis TaxID=31220 RepID=A0AAN9BHP3_9CAEN